MHAGARSCARDDMPAGQGWHASSTPVRWPCQSYTRCPPAGYLPAGVRNTVGFDWDPRTQVLYFGFLERDWQVGTGLQAS